MKKFATILVLVFVFSITIFADGDFPIGNRTCPQGQTCLTDGDIPIGNKTDGVIHIGGLKEDSIFGNVLYFLKSIF